MTVFNVRLGHWSPNPADDRVWTRHDPPFGGIYLLSELFGRTQHSSPFVYLSDGGHFENLGIYELVRRGCRLIIATDAGCDPDYAFDDLAIGDRLPLEAGRRGPDGTFRRRVHRGGHRGGAAYGQAACQTGGHISGGLTVGI